jgi:Protein of unknown function (DUF3108)
MTPRLLFASLLLAPALALAAPPPPPYTANYEVLRNGDRLGKATVVFKALPNGRYELTSNTVGSDGLAAIAGVAIDERSILRWTGEQPETIVYTYRQQLAWKTRERSIQVDAGNRRIESQDKDRRFSPPYQPGVLDRNAITVALMGDLAMGKPGDLAYLVPSKDELETQVYRASAPERLNTALGMQRVVRVERVRESANGRTTTLWLGQDKNFVPLRILQKEPDGDTIEMRITSIR